MKKLLLLGGFIMCYGFYFGQCSIIYTTPTGTGVGSISDPANLSTAISQAVAGDLLKLSTGVYNLDVPLLLKDSVTIEGGFESGSNWIKTSLAEATVLYRTPANPETNGGNFVLTAVYGTASRGFRVQDLTIRTADANISGMSTYGLHLTSCQDYEFVRCIIDAGLAATGDDGTTPSGTGGAGGAGSGGTGGGSNQGCDANGYPGQTGTPGNGGASGGSGGSGANGDNCNFLNCNAFPMPGGNGYPGNTGANGAPPAGAPGASGLAFPFYIPNGQSATGNNGFGGSGGGGGGGMSKGTDCLCNYFGSGTGGVGGTGGGGGLAGTGGYGGGGSFSVYLVNNLLGGVFQDVDVTLNTSSVGGTGGNGQSGSSGSTGSPGQNAGCGSDSATSGSGGTGGPGGSGGKGQDGAPGITYKFAIDGNDVEIIQNGTSTLLTAGGNNPADFNLPAQAVITVQNTVCTDIDIEFNSGTSGVWDFGVNANPQFGSGATITTQYNAAGRSSVTFGSDIYSGFVYVSQNTGAGADAGADQSICSGATNATLSGNQPVIGIGTWISLGTAVISNPNNPSTAVTNLAAGANYFVWATTGCCGPTEDTVIVSVGAPSAGTDVITTCESHTWIDGVTYTSSNNTATHVLPNSAGCDSTVTLNLTINTVDVSVTQIDELTLEANATGAAYQWLDCDNNFIQINGANGSTFNATSNGNYAVQVIQNGCTDTSQCFTIDNVSIEDLLMENEVVLYPNPSRANTTLHFKGNHVAIIEIADNSGRIVLQKKTVSSGELLDVINHEPGAYYLNVLIGDKKRELKFIKQ
jgi:hypothetical protein